MRHSTLLVSLCSLLIACSGNSDEGAASKPSSLDGAGGASGMADGGGQSGASQSGGDAGIGGTAGGSQAAGGDAGAAGAAGLAGGVGESGAGAAGAEDSAPPLPESAAGSYTLVFQTETFTAPPNFPAGGELRPILLGYDFRLDLLHTPAGWQALLTPSLGATGAFSVEVSSSAVTLSGSAYLQEVLNEGLHLAINDGVHTVSLARAADGSLTGEVTAEGKQVSEAGDETDSGLSAFTGTLVRDQVVPLFVVQSGDPAGPTDATLPWNPIQIETSEGVDAAALLASTSLTVATPGDSSYSVVEAPPPADPTAWGGARSLTFTAAKWDGSGSLTLATPAGILDLAGNPAAALQWTSQFAQIGPAVTAHGFQADVAQEASWGLATYFGGAAGSDARCETGSCVVLGPLYDHECVQQPTGIAGRLTASAGDSLSVRYRIESPGTSDGVSPDNMTLEVVVATHDGLSQPTYLPIGVLQDNGAAAGDKRFTGDWTTSSFPIAGPVAMGEVGFELRATPSYVTTPSDDCSGDVYVHVSAPVTVYVGAVTITH